MNEKTTERVRRSFQQDEAVPPVVTSIAPGRVNLIGDHVDYTGGLVMPIAIDRNTAVAIGPHAGDSEMIVDFLDLEGRSGLVVESSQEMDGTDLDYIRGPLIQLHEAGLRIPPLRLTVSSTVPMGAGLSSSAALQVAVLLGIRTYLDKPVSPLEVALEAQRSEHTIGTPCGLMDMYVSAAARNGHACLIDCGSNDLEQVPLPPESEAVFIISDTKVRHDLRDGGYAKRRSECEQAAERMGYALLSQASLEQLEAAALPENLHQRARHVLSENLRVRTFSDALKQGDLKRAGQAMFESHHSLRDDFDVSCKELDLIVEIAETMSGAGIYGSRMTGGGFGGSTITMCRPEAEPEFRKRVAEAFAARFDHQPDSIRTSAADGALVITI
ncbi:MAG: galactokinase [Planctomycetes bacterium TMED75]|nr:galactokinase [Planctomycetaceae bacterium]OUU95976.1 MAG: galactokinase [Planctomycetes bacterium TMED75]